MSQISEKLVAALAPIQPDGVREMIETKLNEFLALVQKNNANVARVVEAKDTDPESADYQDATWRRVVFGLIAILFQVSQHMMSSMLEIEILSLR